LPQWVQDIFDSHPGSEHCQKNLRDLAKQNKLSISWNKQIVARCCGASIAEEGAWKNSTFQREIRARRAKILHDWATSGGTAADIDALTKAIADDDLKVVKATHPGLKELGLRAMDGKLIDTDYKIAAFELSRYPEAPLDSTGRPPAGYTGWQGAYPIHMYQPRQIYLAAKEGLILVELAFRWLEQLIPEELARADLDCDRYSTWTSDDPGYGNRIAGYPIEFYNINAAHSWGGFMDTKQVRSALARLTLNKALPLLGRDKDLTPGDPGYKPLPPLQNPSWQDVGHAHEGGPPLGQRRRND
jgi:hypothetical protein